MNIDFSSVDWWAQIPFFIAIFILIFRIVMGVRRGFVKEVCALVSVIIASIAIVLIAFGVRNYFDHEVVMVVAAIVLILLLGILYKLLELFFVSLKLIAKLPVISFIDKVLGIAIGVAETVVILWALYCIIYIMQPSAFGNWILNCVKNNSIMGYLYANNYLYTTVLEWYYKIAALDIPNKIGFVK